MSALALILLDAFGEVNIIEGTEIYVLLLLIIPPVIGILAEYTASIWYDFLLIRWHLENGPSRPYPEEYGCLLDWKKNQNLSSPPHP